MLQYVSPFLIFLARLGPFCLIFAKSFSSFLISLFCVLLVEGFVIRVTTGCVIYHPTVSSLVCPCVCLRCVRVCRVRVTKHLKELCLGGGENNVSLYSVRHIIWCVEPCLDYNFFLFGKQKCVLLIPIWLLIQFQPCNLLKYEGQSLRKIIDKKNESHTHIEKDEKRVLIWTHIDDSSVVHYY